MRFLFCLLLFSCSLPAQAKAVRVAANIVAECRLQAERAFFHEAAQPEAVLRVQQRTPSAAWLSCRQQAGWVMISTSTEETWQRVHIDY
ncbi:hypothetical protein [Chitinilyticum piscinae]|uniref:Uncharacterized protein n=1 Tax=Chitinilyticum piscinae TaxID=2866724 RepID=A0A8J7FFP8_9NEIS|nr:hypothetical protein [Chitinilyticum piscinae]MBE9608170.1 hypothetical protein [Chitinilyticum piscinae]